MKTPRDGGSLSEDIASLAKRIAAIQEQMRALGVFANDRELLDCPRCGLREDVLISGELITYRVPDVHRDTGLRFEELTTGTFRCPSCGQTVHDPLAAGELRGTSLAKPAAKRPKHAALAKGREPRA